LPRRSRSQQQSGRRGGPRQFNTNYTVGFASYLMALAPLLVYLFAQRWVISGVMRSSIK
jgi:ABC-type glycerol-3-phosphate transport system permease component